MCGICTFTVVGKSRNRDISFIKYSKLPLQEVGNYCRIIINAVIISNIRRYYEMKSKNSLIFIGEKKTPIVLEVSEKPGFGDAIFLSNQPAHTTKKKPYQIIEMEGNKDLSFYSQDKKIHCTINNQKIWVSADDGNLSEEEVIKMCNNFAFMDDKKVTILAMYPTERRVKWEKEKFRNQSASEDLGNE